MISIRARRAIITFGMVALLSIALTLIFFHRLAFTDLILGRGDTFAYFYPYWGARDAALRAGQLPLWSPDLFMGVPLLANSQLGTFYPPNWLTIGFSPPDAVRISVLIHAAWAFAGAFVLARRTVSADRFACLVGAALFAFGGYLGGRVEQINQLQGLSWMPWLFVIFDAALKRPRALPMMALGVGLALQFFTGHTQTVFITAVGLGIFAITRSFSATKNRFFTAVGALTVLILAGVLAAVLALPQLMPTMELTSVSNRRGGLTPAQATAFSFSPFAAGRGLLPNYDTPIFGEYIAYVGVIGLGLALIGILEPKEQCKDAKTQGRKEDIAPKTFAPLRLRAFALIFLSPYVMLSLVGLVLAFGLYNPIYWSLASLPGFNLFRVPARWMALFALGGSMLAAHGLSAWRVLPPRRRLTVTISLLIVVAVLAVGALILSVRNPDGTPITPPESITLIGWGIALAVFLAALWLIRNPRVTAVLLIVELFAAARFQAFNDLVPPETYTGTRFTAAQLGALTENQTPVGRMLSISDAFFDPGDKAALEAHYQALGMSETAIRTALVDTKFQELLAPNLPLAWGIPSIDGFDGGVLPTAYYTAFTSLMLPEGELRTVDGRLRESLAVEACGGACIPDQRWLNLTNTRYLVIDKVFDLWREGVAYDTALEIVPTADNPARYANVQRFEADTVDLLYACIVPDCAPPMVDIPDAQETLREPIERYQLIRYALPDAFDLPEIVVTGDGNARVRALTLVDRRTADDPAGIDFQQLIQQPFTRILSSDIKIYENSAVLPRAFIVYNALVFPDTDLGTEMALEAMRDPNFDPLQMVVLNGDAEWFGDWVESGGTGRATITHYEPTRIDIQIESDRNGWLVLTDAFYPGWMNDSDHPVRADVMFRAFRVSDQTRSVSLAYSIGNSMSVGAGIFVGSVAWVIVVSILIPLFVLRSRNETHDDAGEE